MVSLSSCLTTEQSMWIIFCPRQGVKKDKLLVVEEREKWEYARKMYMYSGRETEGLPPPPRLFPSAVSTAGPYHYENKLAYSNILKISPPKNENFQIKNSDIFHIFAQNIDCGYSLEPPRRGGSNEYPQSVFLSRTKKNNVYPCKPQFYYIKVGFKGVRIL